MPPAIAWIQNILGGLTFAGSGTHTADWKVRPTVITVDAVVAAAKSFQ